MAPVDGLGTLLEKLSEKSSDLPFLVTSLTNASKGSRKLLDRAIDVYEAREQEHDALEAIKALEEHKTSMLSSSDAREAKAIFVEFKSGKESSIKTAKDKGDDASLKYCMSGIDKLEKELMKAFIDTVIKPLADDANSVFDKLARSQEADLAPAVAPLRDALGLVKPHVATAQET